MTKPSLANAPEAASRLSGRSTAQQKALAKWYAAAQAALAHNRPLTMGRADETAGRSAEGMLSSAEREALRAVGALRDDEQPISVKNDPLLKAQAQYMALLEESLSTQQAAKLLKVDVSRIRQRLRERSLFGVEYEGNWRLPRFQFDRHMVIPGFALALKALPEHLFPLDVVDWFLLPNADLELDKDKRPLSPRAWLVAGRPVETVVKLAASFVSV
jgi:hypothetical protein